MTVSSAGEHPLVARPRVAVSVGPSARLEFERLDDARSIDVELPRDTFERLALRVQNIAYLSPTRVRTFGDPPVSARARAAAIADPQPVS